jgi:hypothetical protein
MHANETIAALGFYFRRPESLKTSKRRFPRGTYRLSVNYVSICEAYGIIVCRNSYRIIIVIIISSGFAPLNFKTSQF